MLDENKKAFTSLVGEQKLSSQQAKKVTQYVNLLEEWTTRTNLVSKRDVPKIVSRHIYESLEFCRNDLLPNNSRIMDLGSGAGFPGIMIAVFYPNCQVTLVESRKMKALFLQEVKDQLLLDNIVVVNDRVENLVNFRLFFDVATARAVASLEELWSWSSPLLKRNGMLIAQKGGDVSQEIQIINPEVKISVIPFQFSDPVLDRKLVLLKKES